MVKDDIILLNANGSLIFRLRLVFGQCRLRFMCCMILIRVSHPAQQGPFPPTLGFRSLVALLPRAAYFMVPLADHGTLRRLRGLVWLLYPFGACGRRPLVSPRPCV